MPTPELQRRVDDAMRELVIDDVAVVRVIALRSLSEPHRSCVESVERLKHHAEPSARGRKEGILKRIERLVRIACRNDVALLKSCWELQIRNGSKRFVDFDLCVRIPL